MTQKALRPLHVPLLAGFVLFVGQAHAFGDTAAQVWAARSNAIAAAVNQSVTTGADMEQSVANAEAYIDGIKQSCSGLTGELIKNGGRNMPVWAQTAQQHFCLGATNLGRAYQKGNGDKGYCKDLRSAANYARKAKRGEDPDIVVDAAATLIAASERLASIPIQITKKSVFGDSSRTFSCAG